MQSRLDKKTIAFVTSNDYPDLTPSDRLAAEALRAGGARVLPAIWDDRKIPWADFDLIILRSTWDYYLKPDRFREWIDFLERQRLPVWNPPNVLRWNMNKRYLLDLQKNGIAIPRTCFLDGNGSFDVSQMEKLVGTEEVVVKPVVSASAWNTWRCSLRKFSDDDSKQMDDLRSNTGVMIQEFMPEVATGGEWSMLFFGMQFSHAVRKQPARGDFRVQELLGGTSTLEPNPPTDLIRQAHQVLATIESPLLYARVDGIERNGTLIVMELELLEPSLFFDVEPAAVKRFTDRVTECIKG